MSEYIVDEGHFRIGDTIAKARLEMDTDPLNPWEMYPHIGTLAIQQKGWNVGDENVDSWEEYFYNDIPDLTEEEFEEMNVLELYNRWKKTKAAVIPVSFADYGSNGCRLSYTEDEDEVSTDRWGCLNNEGFYIVEKDNKEIEENNWTKEDLVKCMCSELYEYSQYIEDEVYCVFCSLWNKEKMEWEEEDNCGGIIFPEKLKYGEQLRYALQDMYCHVYERIYQGQVNFIKNHITDPYRNYIKTELCMAVQNSLRDFDNNIKYALKHVLLCWWNHTDFNRDKVLLELFDDHIDFDERALIVERLIKERRNG